MIVERIADATRVLHKPADWDDKANGRCGGLPIRDEIINGVPFMASAWSPTPEELARLNAGAVIHLYVAGQVHPPIAMNVGVAPA